MNKKQKEANARHNLLIKNGDKVPIISGILFIVTVIISVIAGLVINFKSDKIGLVLIILAIISVIFTICFIKVLNKKKPEGYGVVLPVLNKKGKGLVPEVLMSKKIIVNVWIVTVILGSLSIVSYPILGEKIEYKIITMLSLFSWVLWNLINIGYVKPGYKEPIKKYRDAFLYLLKTEIPTMLSLGSIIISIFIYGSEVSYVILYVLTLLIALMIVFLTVIFERG
ncbi:MAG: hypothetical protein AB2388_19815 [Bacillus anthracis]|uniref:hypothetical protein n=1 Tax=Bacillus TaxID=1386 RepID=UPI000872E087|nr:MULTISPECIES: hypothetical protein [Bacillus]MCC0760833.1 hypothetical protein [Bacillus sp. BRTN]MCC0771823.1 hypothetical protein [Bacillus pacificus]OFE37546.1 hypothetical protein BGV83_06940 [Bacillus anthracis]